VSIAGVNARLDNLVANGQVNVRRPSVDTKTLQIRWRLHENMDYALSTDDLFSLCFAIGVDYDSLSGNNKARRIQSLLRKADRLEIMYRMIDKLQEIRPKIVWEYQ